VQQELDLLNALPLSVQCPLQAQLHQSDDSFYLSAVVLAPSGQKPPGGALPTAQLIHL
jgi:hypothetical protein